MNSLDKVSEMASKFRSDLTKVSLFSIELLDGEPRSCPTIEQLVSRIRKPRWGHEIDPLFTLTATSESNPQLALVNAGFTFAVTFSGTYGPTRKIEHLQEHSGLICIGFKNLLPVRATELRRKLLEDPYTYILFSTMYDAGLKVIVKYDYTKPEDHVLYFNHLLDYYNEEYHVTEDEHDPSFQNMCQLCFEPYDPDLYFEPESVRMSLREQVQTDHKHGNYNILSPKDVDTDQNTTPYEMSMKMLENTLLDDQYLSTTAVNDAVQNSLLNNINNDLLARMNELERQIDKATKSTIVSRPALIQRGGVDIIRHGTINIIQGKYGQHKSRLAEHFASLMLAHPECTINFLGFEKQSQEITVCYIDTERNVNDELARAIQRIRQNAGYDPAQSLTDFRFNSLTKTERSERLNAINTYLHGVRQSTAQHLLVILDVVTDCVTSFNEDRQAMKLFDSFGDLCEKYDSTFLLVIHENPSSEKARGHVGTEAANKASTVMQIGSGKDNDKKLIRLRFAKLRSGKIPDDIYLQYSEAANGLVLADEDLVKQINDSTTRKVDEDDIVMFLGTLFSAGEVEQGKIVKQLMEEFNRGKSTMEILIREMIKEKVVIYNSDKESTRLFRRRDGQKYFLHLEPLV